MYEGLTVREKRSRNKSLVDVVYYLLPSRFSILLASLKYMCIGTYGVCSYFSDNATKKAN